MADRYWVGGGASTNWNATGNTNWASSSGGANNASVPGTGDNVFFDANSGAPFAATISASQSIGTLDMTGSTGTLTHNASVTLTVDGAGGVFKLASGVTYTMAANTATVRTITFTGAGTFVLTTAGKLMPSITVNGASTVVQLADAFTGVNTFSATLTLTAGHFDANDFAVTILNVNISGSTARTLSMGSGLWSITGGSTLVGTWTATTTTNLTFNKETANIVWAPGIRGNNHGFEGGGLTYNQLTITGIGDNYYIAGINTFSALVLTGPLELAFNANQTITAAPSWVGTRAAPIIVRSNVASTTRTITITSGGADCDYLLLRSITFLGGSTHYAGYHSVNLGDVTGFTFSANPAYTLTITNLDSAGSPLVGSTVYAGKVTSGVWEQAAAAGTTDGSGVAAFSVRDNTAAYGAMGFEASGTRSFGSTDFNLTPV